MTWKRRGGQKVIIAPDGSDVWAPAKSRPDEMLIRVLARAHRWKRMLEAGRYRSAQEIADAEKIGRSFVSRLLRLTLLAPDIQEAILEGRLLRLTLLAPDIQEAILEGRQAKGMQLEELMGAVPWKWGEQRLIAGGSLKEPGRKFPAP
jgi:hypothetical protein